MFRRIATALAVCALGFAAVADAAELTGLYLRLTASPEGGEATELRLGTAGENLAAGSGLFQEGFGVGSYYLPNRRLNERMERIAGSGGDALVYAYDCEGPNIQGLHVQRRLELAEDATTVRVHWIVENRGDEQQWLAPWMRHDLAPSGTETAGARIDLPTLDGVRRVEGHAYHPVARNWFAVTDPASRVSVAGVFDAQQLLAVCADARPGRGRHAVQAAFVPQMLAPGERWETRSRLAVFRGLERVDFATTELAAQIDYADGRLQVLIAAAQLMNEALFQARVRTPGGETIALPDKRFTVHPARLARCTYEWEAPEDGVYEFLAQIVDQSEPIALGEGVRPPHGGIDTQFTVGRGGPAPLPAWTDAPHALDRGPRVLPRAMAASGRVDVWIEDALEKIGRSDRAHSTGEWRTRVNLEMAANEYESFQVVLRPEDGADVANVSVHVNDLDGPGGARIAASNISVHRVAYVPVVVPSHFENPTGPVPDPLPPFAPFTARGGEASPLWFTVHAPPGTPAGNYRGMLEIAGAGMEPIELWIEVMVLPFELPATPTLKTDFVYWSDAAFEACRRMGYAGSREELDARYLDHALRRRVTLRELTQLPAETADYRRTLDRFAGRAASLRSRGATTFAVPPSLLDLPELLAEAEAFVVREGLQDRVFCPMAVDPPRPAWPRVLEAMQRWRDTAPSIPLMIAARGLEPFLTESAGIWAIHTPMFDTVHGEGLVEHIRGGGEVWAYVNHAPSRPYANFLLDFAAVEHRALTWQLWALGVKGLHHWGVNYVEPGQDPWRGQLDVTPVNGDGFLVYPSASGPVTSIRWETLRDAIEDYEYLTLLQRRALALQERGGHEPLLREAAAALDLGGLITSLTDFQRDPAAMQLRRREIGRLIVRINEALAGAR